MTIPHRTVLFAAVLAALFGTLTGRPARGAEARATEAQLLRYADEHNGEALALLERVVNLNSGTMNFDGVRAVGAVFRAELDALGFRTRWVDGAPFGRAGHLIAERPAAPRAGAHPLRVLLIGHLDTVFERDSPFQRFARLPGDRASGPGVIDMKGGDVVLLQALKALQAAGALDRLSVAVVLHGDEESAGAPQDLARRDLVEAAASAEVALGFEDGDGQFEHAVVARRGACGWRLTTTGQPAHSGLVFRPEVGAGALYEAARIVDAFRRDLSGEAYLTVNPGVALGGTAVAFDADHDQGTAAGKSNVVAGQAVVAGDLRTISPEQLQSAEQRMRDIVADHLPRTAAWITFTEGYPPMAPTEGNQRLLARFDEVSRDLGYGPVTAVDPSQAGAADISFVAAKVGKALDALGLKGGGGHTADEVADLTALPRQTKRVAVFLWRLSEQRP